MHKTTPVLLLMGAGLLASIGLFMLAHLRFGSFDTPLSDIVAALRGEESRKAFAIYYIRLPRALNALFVGMALAVSGALIQVMTRNPLGDPGLTGVSGGAAFGVAFVFTYIAPASYLVVFGGITGGFIAAAITFALSRSSGFNNVKILLAGAAVSIFFIAATSSLMLVERSSMQALYYWMIGGFNMRGWDEFSYLWAWVVAGLGLSLLATPYLELLRLDDHVAQSLGVRTARWRVICGVISVILAAVAVSVAGPLGFVGFVAPHIVRRACAACGHEQISLFSLFTLACLTGGALTLLADLGARLLPLGNRAPAGVLVTIFGGLMFLVLARKTLRELEQ